MTAKKVGYFVSFSQAEVTLLCRKLYKQEILKVNMPYNIVKTFYSDDDLHDMYIGEVVKIVG